jgi:predicted porin
MKKSLIALAVASAFVAPAAMADTTIYGSVNMSFDYTDNGDANGVNGTSTNQIMSNGSAIGFKGTEDLGGGTSAIWQIETAVTPDQGNNGWATNDAFGGLSGESWGTLILGQHDTPYNMATRSLDLFQYGIADNRSLMGMTGGGGANHDIRLGNVIAYISPAMSGFTVAAAYVAGAENATLSGQTKADAYSLAGMYSAGPLYAALAYQEVKGGTACGFTNVNCAAVPTSSDKAKAWELAASYTMNAFTINGIYEKTSGQALGLGVDNLDQTNYYLAAKYMVNSSDAVKVAYTHASTNPQAGASSADVANSDAKQYSIGYDHDMSKHTTVYALYTKLNNGDGATYQLGESTGDASSGTVANIGPGADPSAWSVGIRHSF